MVRSESACGLVAASASRSSATSIKASRASSVAQVAARPLQSLAASLSWAADRPMRQRTSGGLTSSRCYAGATRAVPTSPTPIGAHGRFRSVFGFAKNLAATASHSQVLKPGDRSPLPSAVARLCLWDFERAQPIAGSVSPVFCSAYPGDPWPLLDRTWSGPAPWGLPVRPGRCCTSWKAKRYMQHGHTMSLKLMVN